MTGRLPIATAALLLVLSLTPEASGQTWRDAFALRRDADVLPYLEVAAGALLPLAEPASEVNGLGGHFGGFVNYTDAYKHIRLTVALADYHMVYRARRGRYDAGSFPTLDIFDFTVQFRALPQLHLIYGAGIARAGAMTHSESAGLAFRLGFALPLFGRNAPTMRDYRRTNFQLEAIPLAGSFLTNHHAEGFFDFEAPGVQLQGEVAATGRLRTVLGNFDAETRLSASYHRQHSMFLNVGLRWTSHVFWGRLAGTFHAQYVVPLRPYYAHESDETRRLVHQHHFALAFGMQIYLTVPRIREEDTREHRRRTIEEYFETAREQRQERLNLRREMRRTRRAERRGGGRRLRERHRRGEGPPRSERGER